MWKNILTQDKSDRHQNKMKNYKEIKTLKIISCNEMKTFPKEINV